MRNNLFFSTVLVLILATSFVFAGGPQVKLIPREIQPARVDGTSSDDLIELDLSGFARSPEDSPVSTSSISNIISTAMKIVVRINGVVIKTFSRTNIPPIISVFAGGGNDEIIFDADVSRFTILKLHGGEGDDTIQSEQHINLTNPLCQSGVTYKRTEIIGSFGDDDMYGGCGDDFVSGFAGNDTINVGGNGYDLVWGGPDNDDIIAWTGDDVDCGDDVGDILRYLASAGSPPTYTDCANIEPF